MKAGDTLIVRDDKRYIAMTKDRKCVVRGVDSNLRSAELTLIDEKSRKKVNTFGSKTKVFHDYSIVLSDKVKEYYGVGDKEHVSYFTHAVKEGKIPELEYVTVQVTYEVL